MKPGLPKSYVLVIGPRDEAALVSTALRDDGMRVRRIDTLDAADSMPEPSACVLMTPLKRVGIAEALGWISSRWNVPVCVTVDSQASNAFADIAYLRGADLVIEWPRECLMLAALTRRMIEHEARAEDADSRLARALVSRLADMPAKHGLDVTVQDQCVYVAGSVDSLRQLDELARYLASLPGVTAVRIDELRIVPRDDDDIEREIRAILKTAALIPHHTISTRVRSGVARVAGCVPSRNEYLRIEGRLRAIKGVRDIDMLVTVSKEQYRKDAANADAVQRGLDAVIDPDEPVDVRVFGDVAVLRGQVGSRREEERAIEFAKAAAPIEHIIDRLRVEPDRRHNGGERQ